jgi:hypothetical protein
MRLSLEDGLLGGFRCVIEEVCNVFCENGDGGILKPNCASKVAPA